MIFRAMESGNVLSIVINANVTNTLRHFIRLLTETHHTLILDILWINLSNRYL